MSEALLDTLEKKLYQLLGEAVPDQAVYDIHAAMALAGILEAKGFRFQLKDLCPRSMDENAWRATFFKDDTQFSADHSHPSVAVCTAVIGALSPGSEEED